MKKFLFWVTLGALLALWAAVGFAQPDPRDSIILQSKAVAPNQAHPGTGTDTAAIVYQRLWITNKDSLAGLTFAGIERSISGGAYLIIGRPRNFNGAISMLSGTLNGNRIFNFRYNSATPDSFLFSGLFDPLDPATIEPPNATRKAIWEIKWDSVRSGGGTVEIDTGRVVQSTVFTTAAVNPADLPVNFVKGLFWVDSTDVHDVSQGQRPTVYSLSQNYPNPFNANTQISFALPKSGKATLEIFNILGQKVNTLVNEYMTAGYKIVNWDGRDNRGMEVPSGIYFYRLRSEEFLQTKKMLMIQ